MKKLLFLFALTFCFIGCSEDEEPNTQDEEQNNEEALIIEGGTIATFQLVTLALENVTQENYAGVINGNSINLVRSENNTLSFLVDDNFTIGESILDIVDLNTKVRYTVNETILQNPVTETLESLSANFNNYVDGLGNTDNTPQEITVINVVANFNEALTQMNEVDRTIVAKTYSANKTFFDTLFDVDYTIPQTRNVVADYSDLSFKALTINWAAATIGAGIATWTAVASSSLPLIALPLGVAAYILWQISFDLWSEGIDRANVVYDQFEWDDYISNPFGRAMANGIEFDNGITKSLDFDVNTRGIDQTDANSDNSTFNTFFTTITDLNAVINNLNGVINVINTVPFTNFDLIDTIALGTANTETDNANQEFFNNLSFSIGNSNLNLGNPTFSNGNINITISIIDESIVEEFVESEIDYSYEDDTNNFTGSFPVRVNKDVATISLTGSWIIVEPNGSLNNSSLIGTTTVFDCSTGNSNGQNSNDFAQFNTFSFSSSNDEAIWSTPFDTYYGTYQLTNENNFTFNISIEDTNNSGNMSFNGEYDEANLKFSGNFEFYNESYCISNTSQIEIIQEFQGSVDLIRF